MRRKAALESVELECYTDKEVISGSVRCPAEVRLIDVFNSRETNNGGEFVHFIDTSDAATARTDWDERDIYVKKSAIQFMAISDAETRRGAGAKRGRRCYPFVSKYPAQVSLRLATFTLMGTVHLCPGQTIEGVLNDGGRFLPLTEVTIGRDDQAYGNRAFVAVNREQIIWSRKETL
jgi:hypothetical protein